MVHYDLICDKEHAFEGWFAGSAAYDEQHARGDMNCPVCGSSNISKGIMAPNIAAKANRRPPAKAMLGQQAEMREFLRQMRSHIEANSEHVGDKFPEEARKIHYGESEARNIFGDATLEEVKELREEGIEIAAIPWVEPEN